MPNFKPYQVHLPENKEEEEKNGGHFLETNLHEYAICLVNRCYFLFSLFSSY
jgi:hypothetical protein